MLVQALSPIQRADACTEPGQDRPDKMPTCLGAKSVLRKNAHMQKAEADSASLCTSFRSLADNGPEQSEGS